MLGGREIKIFTLVLMVLPGISNILFDNDTTIMDDVISNPFNKIFFRNECVKDVGCFSTGPPFFHPIYRPISVLPKVGMKPKFWLFTPTQKQSRYQLQLTLKSLESSTFDKSLPTKFLIHGFFGKVVKGDARFRMKDAFLEEGNYNVIIVDWSDYNGFPYFQAVANTRMVGALIAQLVRFLQKHRGVSPQSIHLIGHSLGAHIAGYAGEKIPNLYRISGLDPAGPYFIGTEKEVHLDSTDADFVDIMHTNMGLILVNGLGMPDAIGHLDFYPNGGKHQPICDTFTIVNVTIAGINITAVGHGEGMMAISCDHNAASEYYISSIRHKNCTFVGTKCKNYEMFVKGTCVSGAKSAMGYPATKPVNVKQGGKYYLQTSDYSPNCTTSVNY